MSGPSTAILSAIGPAILKTANDPANLETRSTLRWLDLPEAWVIGLLIVPALVALVWWSYRRENALTLTQRTALVSFRLLALAVILIASFRPAQELTRNLKVRTEVHFLVDDSASMGRHESYAPERASEIRTALGVTAPADLTELSRVDLVGRFLGGGGEGAAARALGPGKKLLTALERDFDLRWFRFWDRSYPVAGLDELSGKGPATRIGDTIDLHLAHHGVDATKLEAMFVLTDGRNNEGLPPLDSATRLAAAEVPLHVIGVGEPGNEQNLMVSGPPGPQQVLQNEEAVFELSVHARGMTQHSFTALVKAQRHASDGSKLDEMAITKDTASDVPMPADRETRKVTLRATFAEPGDYILTFSVPPLPGETNPRDNVTRRYLRVDSDQIRVLYVEDRPRWEYRYLKNALKRVDKSVRVQCWLCDASDAFPQEHSEGLPALTELPRTKKELFAYHVVLIGDLAPSRIATTEEATSKWLELLKEFVEHGGGLGFIAGSLAMPEAYRESAIEDLLPVVLSDFGDIEAPASVGERFVPMMESPHSPHPIVRLQDDLDVNRRLWEAGLEGMSWYHPVLRAKAGATVLLRHPVDENKYGRRVLAALAPYPRGQVFYTAIDETWRWRKFYGEKYQDRFWRNIVRALAENKLRQMDDRVVLVVDRNEVDVGDRVRIELSLLDTDYNPVLAETARIHLRLPSGELQSISVPRLLGEHGRFEGVVPLSDAGVYSVLYYESGNPSGRPLARQDVSARVPGKELSETSLNEAGLVKLAEAAKGRYVPVWRMDSLLDGFAGRGAAIKTVDRKVREAWDHAWTVLLVILLLAVEWILRKRWRLI